MKYKNRIKSLKNKVKKIDESSLKFGSKTFWFQVEVYGDNEKEFSAVKKGKKPMGLIHRNLKNKAFIQKVKDFCDKKSGYSWDIVMNNQFVYGKNFNVYAAKHIDDFSNFDVALGLLLGYSKEHIAAFNLRIQILFGNKDMHYPTRPIRSRNPIKDVLNGKRDLVQINFKDDGSHHISHFVNKKIKELKKICDRNKNLSFLVLYKKIKCGEPFIVFGQKSLMDKVYIK